MSRVAHAYTDDKEGAALPPEAPDGQVSDSSYSTGKSEPIPVQDDTAPVEDPIRPEKANSDEQLGKHCFPSQHMHPSANKPIMLTRPGMLTDTIKQDEKEAIDKSNIIKERTRGAPPKGTYQGPSDEKDLVE
ncbi:uncharacterized protein B0I36DRAFT_398894 [Microdochium trichocladiopsis]|uniref:Uncharacterized protein n=1 Tax=Microdochium trichocladiopsis TaxID=1682393 RepID=A0A9P8XU58_9PEZI|nr:uncharacterized protein B0I36DRAFT_398894 [Microdochium trichocladiopsis]KAH7012500.1 hypothetical protein B0I36DRAFT_398894 [Microdochium trichocladiopsis]